jgi:1,2-diacylglycerol 3-beta-galactosyltransferase
LRVLCLHTGAGGGHTSAIKAVIEAMENRYGDHVIIDMVDALKDYAPRPLNLAPESYSHMIKSPQFYRQFYELGNGRRRSRLVMQGITLYTRQAVDTLLDEHPADIIVSTYHFASSPVMDALARRHQKIPVITVVTDLVTIPPVWFDLRAAITVVPTEPAYHQALIAGLPSERIRRIGLPVSPRFVATTNKTTVRRRLGWPLQGKIVLLMAGGAGVGPLGGLSEAIIAAGIAVTPVIVTGKNRRLAARLRKQPWANKALIYDFVEDMPAFMQAADVLITKAGPGTITEALNTNLPMILYSRIPGQEEGNVEYVSHTGAGYWAPKKPDLVATLRYLVHDEQALHNAQLAAKRLANPQAADTIARLVIETAEQHPTAHQ